ncbi:MAG: BamA/TamA family outer membrane protein, partial [Bacteroidales bacterium]|nr:BamA/TamA family outer membrane protein [Bacteroidales bacterium]
SEAALDDAADRIALALRNKGYYGFTKNYMYFEADTLHTRDSANLKVTVGNYTRYESPKDSITHSIYTFGDVSITYPENFKFRDKFLQDVNLLKKGDTYSETIVNNTYNRYGSLGVFSRVNVNLYPDNENKTVDTKIELSPSKIQGFKINLEASVNSTGLFGISPQVSYYHKNIFHGGERLSLGFVGNYQFRFGKNPARSIENGVNAALDFPRFVFLPARLFRMEIPHTTISASYNHQSRPEYTRNIISTTYSYKGVVGKRRRLNYVASPLRLNIVNMFNVDSAFFKSISSNPFLKNAYQNHFDLGCGLNLYYTNKTTSSPFYVRTTFDIAGNILSLFNPLMPMNAEGHRTIWNTPYSQYVRLEFNIGQTWNFGLENKFGVAIRAVIGAGYAYGNSSALPFERHFWAGGASSLRGFQSRTVGPGRGLRNKTFVIPNQTGDMKIEANVEFRFPIVWKLEGAGFIDAGNVWTINSKSADAALTDFSLDHFFDSVALCSGVGIRLNLDFIVLRFDLGWPLFNPGGFDNGEHWAWHANRVTKGIVKPVLQFGIGYPF